MKVEVNKPKLNFKINVGDLLLLNKGEPRLVVYVHGKYNTLDLECGSLCLGDKSNLDELYEFYKDHIVDVIPAERLVLKEV